MKNPIKASLSLLLCILTLSGCGKGETTIPSSTPGSTNTATPTTPTDKDTTTSSTNAEQKYTDFSEEDKELQKNTIGTTIPFAPCYNYKIELVEGTKENYLKGEFNGLTADDINSYLSLLKTTYEVSNSTEDSGSHKITLADDTISLTVDYEDGGNKIFFEIHKANKADDKPGDVPSQTIPSNWDDVSNKVIYTNKEKGIENYRNSNGYYNVDFTKATKAKNISNLSTYEGGCPTTGNVNVLVIPVEFSDKLHTSKQSLSSLDLALNGGDGEKSLKFGMSVSKYYNLSSNGKLNLNFEIMGGGTKWYKPSKSSTYYINQDKKNSSSNTDMAIVNSILKANSSDIDFSHFDSDNNGMIDAVVIVPTIKIGNPDESILQWAYRYWDITDNTYGDNYCINDYLWCPYDFLYETDSGYDNGTTPTNTYTFTHEFGHVLGAEDYYDASYTDKDVLLNGEDIMDSCFGDQNPYTKFNYGWLTSSKLITATDTVTLDLNAFENGGDTYIIANNWDATLGCYQEYWVMMYYTKSGINVKSNYSFSEGLVLYHIDAQLISYKYNGQTGLDLFTTNDHGEAYYTGVNLIELEKLTSSSYTLGVGQTSKSSIHDDNGSKINYTFKLNSMDGSKANITFKANK